MSHLLMTTHSVDEMATKVESFGVAESSSLAISEESGDTNKSGGLEVCRTQGNGDTRAKW